MLNIVNIFLIYLFREMVWICHQKMSITFCLTSVDREVVQIDIFMKAWAHVYLVANNLDGRNVIFNLIGTSWVSEGPFYTVSYPLN